MCSLSIVKPFIPFYPTRNYNAFDEGKCKNGKSRLLPDVMNTPGRTISLRQNLFCH